MTTEKITELEKTLAKCKIKEANGIDCSAEILTSLQAFASERPDKNNDIQNNHRLTRWLYGLSSPSNPDIKHDTEKLMEYVEELESAEVVSEKIAKKITASVGAIVDDSMTDLDPAQALFSCEFIPEFLEEYHLSDELDADICRFVNLCKLFADIADEKEPEDYIYAKLLGHSLLLMSVLDMLRLMQRKKNQP